jgi:hypothetical protein
VRTIAGELLDNEKGWQADLDAAHEHCDELNQILPLVANTDYLYALLRAESQRRESSEGLPTISGLYGGDLIAELLRRYEGRRETSSGFGPRDRTEVQELLREFYRERDDERRHRRAKINLRRAYLRWYGFVIGPLLASIGVGAFLLGSGDQEVWARLLFVATTGALGSALAAAFKIRDFEGTLLEMQAITMAFRLQPLFGAALGVVALLVLQVGAVRFGQLDNFAWQTQGLVAFAAGLSQPFILGIVSRSVAGSAKDIRAD